MGSKLSKTAIFVAVARAVGAREPDVVARNPDFLAEKILGDAWVELGEHPIATAFAQSYEEAMKDLEIVRHVRTMIVRTRFMDEVITEAHGAGIRQIVIFGAGLASYAYRHRELLSDSRVFEVDRPAMRIFKTQRVDQLFGDVGDGVRYVSMDLGKDDPHSVLRLNHYDCEKRTLFLLEGLSMYLSNHCMGCLLRFISRSCPGSYIAFDYLSLELVYFMNRVKTAMVPAENRPAFERSLQLIREEPWVFGLTLGAEEGYLAPFRIRIQQQLDIGADEARCRYLTRSDGSIVGGEAVSQVTAPYGEPSLLIGRRANLQRLRSRRRLMSPHLIEGMVI